MDSEQFKSDIIPLRPRLVLIASKIVRNEDDAEDVVQEVLLRLWHLRGELGRVNNPAGYAATMTRNICIDRLRTTRETVEIDTLHISQSETPDRLTEQRDEVSLIKRIIDRLPPLQQMIIRMRDIEGYELSEIAEITGAQTATVTVNLSRARKRVRDEFLKITSYGQ